jgi:hypothetical protein
MASGFFISTRNGNRHQGSGGSAVLYESIPLAKQPPDGENDADADQ